MELINEILIKGLVGRYLEKIVFETPATILVIFTLILVACTLSGYFLGSLNFGIIISKIRYGSDIRSHGSQNAGTTNMLRTYGKSAAIATLVGDMAKGLISTVIGYILFGINGAALAGFACIVGHCYPIYYGFKGGKGVATAAMVVLTLNPLLFLVLLLVFVFIVATTKYVSLASIMAMLLYPLFYYNLENIAGRGGPYVLLAVATSVLIILKHKDNIKRLREGKESKINLKGKKDGNQ